MAEVMFTWVATHRDLVEFIRKNRSNQILLLETLANAGVEKLHERLEEGGPFVPLATIDPFSFFFAINKYGSAKRLEILQALATQLNLSYPTDENGIPTANAQQVFAFPFSYEREDDHVESLWDLFEQAVDHNVDDEVFAKARTVPYAGLVKITEGLFHVDPESYLPINAPVQRFLREVHAIDPTFSSWTEYEGLLSRVQSILPKPFYELSYGAWKWSKEHRRSETVPVDGGGDQQRFWVFQSNPAVFDVEEALRGNSLVDWTVSAHRSVMKPGDIALIYQAGKDAGVYGVAELTSVPYVTERRLDSDGTPHERPAYKVDLTVIHNLADNPISRQLIDKDARLSSFKGGKQGTNFTLTSQEYSAVLEIASARPVVRYWLFAPGKNASRWQSMCEAEEMTIGWSELGDLMQYASKTDIEVALTELRPQESRPTNNARACFEFANVLKTGDVVIAKKGKSEYIGWGVVTSEYVFDPGRTDHKHIRRMKWIGRGSWQEPTSQIVTKTLTDITKYPDYVERLVKQIGIDVSTSALIDARNTPAATMNTIIYGPPGTGKTYTTVNKALEIIDPTFLDGERDRQSLKARFDELVQDEQICFMTFHQSMSYEDFIEGIKPSATSASGQITYEVQDGLFKDFCEKARANWEASQKSQAGQLSFEEAWQRFVQEWEDDPEVRIPTARTHYTIVDIRAKTIVFRKATGSISHSLSINTLREFYYNRRRMMRGGLGVYYPGLVSKLQSYAGDTESAPLKRYVFIIDEINRGNVSQIFGELITLIEDTKRLGEPEALLAILPYSNDEFGVPPNVYLLGTMNTADRSVEALDTALRRRFSFVEMPPVYELEQLQAEHHGVILANLLKKINQRIEVLLDRDHMIGHSYFLESPLDLQDVFQHRIIPLLQEYFYADYGKIGLVLGRGFVEHVEYSHDANVFADFDYNDAGHLAERIVYRIKKPSDMLPEEFAAALRQVVE